MGGPSKTQRGEDLERPWRGGTWQEDFQPRTGSTEQVHSLCGQAVPPGPRGAHVRCVRCPSCVAVLPAPPMETGPALITNRLIRSLPELHSRGPAALPRPDPRSVRTDPPSEAENSRLNIPRRTQPESQLSASRSRPQEGSPCPASSQATRSDRTCARARGFPGPPAGLRPAAPELGAARPDAEARAWTHTRAHTVYKGAGNVKCKQ